MFFPRAPKALVFGKAWTLSSGAEANPSAAGGCSRGGRSPSWDGPASTGPRMRATSLYTSAAIWCARSTAMPRSWVSSCRKSVCSSARRRVASRASRREIGSLRANAARSATRPASTRGSFSHSRVSRFAASSRLCTSSATWPSSLSESPSSSSRASSSSDTSLPYSLIHTSCTALRVLKTLCCSRARRFMSSASPAPATSASRVAS
mmetsp:Transcript_18597/g.54473  ORF Transcript_18597/g.54473 Transcript_18597/m.54473 type:complete len:207 (-) Transcript_18597:239-859(-)